MDKLSEDTGVGQAEEVLSAEMLFFVHTLSEDTKRTGI